MLNLHQWNIHIFSNSSDDNADILAANLSKSYCAWFSLILSLKFLSYSVNVIFIKNQNDFSKNLKGLLRGNVVLIVKKEYGSLVQSP